MMEERSGGSFGQQRSVPVASPPPGCTSTTSRCTTADRLGIGTGLGGGLGLGALGGWSRLGHHGLLRRRLDVF